MRPGILLGTIVVISFSQATQTQTPPGAVKPADVLAPARPAALVAYENTRKSVLEAAALMPDSDYGTRLAEPAKSFDEIVAHAVLTNFGVCAGARKEENPKKGVVFEGAVTTKAELVPLLKASFEYCDPAFAAGAATPGSDLLFAISHNQRLLGLLETYLRTKGLAITNSEIDRPKKKS